MKKHSKVSSNASHNAYYAKLSLQHAQQEKLTIILIYNILHRLSRLLKIKSSKNICRQNNFYQGNLSCTAALMISVCRLLNSIKTPQCQVSYCLLKHNVTDKI